MAERRLPSNLPHFNGSLAEYAKHEGGMPVARARHAVGVVVLCSMTDRVRGTTSSLVAWTWWPLMSRKTNAASTAIRLSPSTKVDELGVDDGAFGKVQLRTTRFCVVSELRWRKESAGRRDDICRTHAHSTASGLGDC